MSRMYGGAGKGNNDRADGTKGPKKSTHYIAPRDDDFDNSVWEEEEEQDKLRREKLHKEYEASRLDKRTPEERMIDERREELAQLKGNGARNKQQAADALHKMLQERQGGEIPDSVKKMMDNPKIASQNAQIAPRQQQTKTNKVDIPDTVREKLAILRAAKMGRNDNEGDSLPKQEIVPGQIPPAPPPPSFMKGGGEIPPPPPMPAGGFGTSGLINKGVPPAPPMAAYETTSPKNNNQDIRQPATSDRTALLNALNNSNPLKILRKTTTTNDRSAPKLKNTYNGDANNNYIKAAKTGGTHITTIEQPNAPLVVKDNVHTNDFIQPTRDLPHVTSKRGSFVQPKIEDHIYENLKTDILPNANRKKRQAPKLDASRLRPEQVNRQSDEEYFKEQGKKLVGLNYRIHELEKKGKFLNRIFEKKDAAKRRIDELADLYKTRQVLRHAMEDKNKRLADEVVHNARHEARIIRKEAKNKKGWFRR